MRGNVKIAEGAIFSTQITSVHWLRAKDRAADYRLYDNPESMLQILVDSGEHISIEFHS